MFFHKEIHAPRLHLDRYGGDILSCLSPVLQVAYVFGLQQVASKREKSIFICLPSARQYVLPVLLNLRQSSLFRFASIAETCEHYHAPLIVLFKLR